MKNILVDLVGKRNKKQLTFRLLTLLACIFAFGQLYAGEKPHRLRILVDIAHKPIFWNDPLTMEGMPEKRIKRAKYMKGELVKNASSINAEVLYLKEELNPENLSACDLLFIHVPSAMYAPQEISAVKRYLEDGGSLFLVMDVDYWSSLEQTNVNELISSFGIQFGSDSPDTLVGGYAKAGDIVPTKLKIPYHGARLVTGGTPFCFSGENQEYAFGTFKRLKNGGKIIVKGEAMTSLYMTSWKDVHDYQCAEFMHDVFKWLLY